MSLICLKWSMSTIIAATMRPDSRVDASSGSPLSNNTRRDSRRVSGSVVASARSSSAMRECTAASISPVIAIGTSAPSAIVTSATVSMSDAIPEATCGLRSARVAATIEVIA